MEHTDFKWKINTMPKTDDKNLPIMSIEEVEKAKKFHKSFPQYSETPLVDLKELAKYLGINKVCINNGFTINLITISTTIYIFINCTII